MVCSLGHIGRPDSGSRRTGHAADAPKIDSGDTAWMLTSAALVLTMTAPGLALFYGGLLGNQVLAVLVSYGLAIVGSLVCLAITSLVAGGLRASEDDEFAGLASLTAQRECVRAGHRWLRRRHVVLNTGTSAGTPRRARRAGDGVTSCFAATFTSGTSLA